MKKKLLLVLGIVLLLLVGAYFLWPVLDAQLMKIPMNNAVAELSNTDAEALAACFTSDATLLMTQSEAPVPVKEVIDTTMPMLKNAQENMPVISFKGFNDLRREGNKARAGFSALVQVEGVPVKYNGIVTLQRSSLFSWKIAVIGIYDFSPHDIMSE